MTYGFELTNLRNDKTMAMLTEVTPDDIKRAIELHQITIEDIGITIFEL